MRHDTLLLLDTATQRTSWDTSEWSAPPLRLSLKRLQQKTRQYFQEVDPTIIVQMQVINMDKLKDIIGF